MSNFGEPWRVRDFTEFASQLPEPSNGQSIGMIYDRADWWRPSTAELVQRIIACVNFCAALDTETLLTHEILSTKRKSQP